MSAPQNPDRSQELHKILQDFEQQRSADHEHERRTQLRALRRTSFRHALIWCAVGAGSVLVLWGMVSMGEAQQLFAPRAQWVNGVRADTDVRVDSCIAHLWRIREAVDAYYLAQQALPENMEALKLHSTLRAPADACPLSKESYELEKRGQAMMVVCPTPWLHGVSGVYLPLASGPPVIERDPE